MITIEELKDLFIQGYLPEFIQEAEAYLNLHPQDTEVLFMMAIAHHDRVYSGDPKRLFEAIKIYTLPLLREILVLEPANSQARYHILNAVLNNEYDLVQMNSAEKHISRENIGEYISYAQHLTLDPESAIYGYNFLISLYELIDAIPDILQTLDRGMEFLSSHFKQDREQREQNVSIYFCKKIYLLHANKLASGDDISVLINSHLQNFASSNDMDYLQLADIVFEHGNIVLAKKLLLKLVRGVNDAPEVLEGMVRWHARFDQLIQNGLVDDDVFYFQLIVERSHFKLLQVSSDFYYHRAVQLIKLHPACFSAYHFAGTYLHEEDEHTEATVLLSKALEIKTSAVTWRRYLISRYMSTGEIDVDVPEFQDLPRDLYNDAVELSDFVQEKVTDEDDLSLMESITSAIYEKSEHAFRAYFEENAYESDYLGSRHNWAMCCNNYSIALIKLGCYETAVHAAYTGLKQSEFEELHHTLLDALLKQENYAAAKTATERFFKIYNSDNSNFYRYLQHQGNYLLIRRELGEDNTITEAQDLLFRIYEHYEHHPDISDYDYRDYEAAKNTVEGFLYNHYENESQEFKIKHYTGIAAHYPREAQPQYVLMQIYNELEDYRQVNKAARLYLRNKKEFIMNDFDKAKTLYMIMKSNYLVNEFDAGIEIFETHNSFCAITFERPEYVQWLIYGMRLLAAKQMIEPLLVYAGQMDDIYTEEGWSYDDTAEEIQLLVANTYYLKGDLKNAHQRLDLVLGYTDHAALADEYKRSWKKPGLFSKFF